MPQRNIYAGKKCFHDQKPAYGDLWNAKGHFYLCYSHWYAYDKELNRLLRIIEDRQWGDQEWYREAFPRRLAPPKPENTSLL